MKILCPTPQPNCQGALCITNNTMKKTIKLHSSHEDAFKCYESYLLKSGYTKIRSREYRPPDGGPILLLTRISRFGQELRKGKSGEGGVKGSRFIPRTKRGGLIIST